MNVTAASLPNGIGTNVQIPLDPPFSKAEEICLTFFFGNPSFAKKGKGDLLRRRGSGSEGRGVDYGEL
jgi:hypothetical protein